MCKLLSVVVPVYNVEEYLEECLSSLINQTLDNLEIIVVNDGSTDNSDKIIEKFIEKEPNIIRYYKKKMEVFLMLEILALRKLKENI